MFMKRKVKPLAIEQKVKLINSFEKSSLFKQPFANKKEFQGER